MLGIPAQPGLQPIPRIKQSHTVFGEELRPLLDRPRVVSHEFGDGAPLAGSSRSHRFITTAGRGAAGPSSNSRSSSTSTGIPSGISGRCSTSQDSQPCEEKKLKITSGDDRNTTRPDAKPKHPARQPHPRQSQHGN